MNEEESLIGPHYNTDLHPASADAFVFFKNVLNELDYGSVTKLDIVKDMRIQLFLLQQTPPPKLTAKQLLNSALFQHEIFNDYYDEEGAVNFAEIYQEMLRDVQAAEKHYLVTRSHEDGLSIHHQLVVSLLETVPEPSAEVLDLLVQLDTYYLLIGRPELCIERAKKVKVTENRQQQQDPVPIESIFADEVEEFDLMDWS